MADENTKEVSTTAEEVSAIALAEVYHVIDMAAGAPSEKPTYKPEGEEEAPVGEDTEDEAETEPIEITPEMHDANLAVMGEVLETVVEMATEGKLPEKEEKEEFEMKKIVDSTVDLLGPPEEEEEVEVKEEEFESPEGSAEEKEGEAEEEESASVQEAWLRRQQRLEEFDAVHDEGQRLRIMNLLLQSRVMRSVSRRPKKRRVSSSTASDGSTSSAGGNRQQEQIAAGNLAGIAESLERELLEAGEVRRQLEVETHGGAEEEDLRKRLAEARSQVAEMAEHLQHLQEKLLKRMRAPPVKMQEAERMLKRAWPQLLRLRRERLLHSRAQQELASARQQVKELEAFGRDRSVAAYEELAATGVKLAEQAQERADQLAALRATAERNVQQAAHFREELRAARRAALEAHIHDTRAQLFLKQAREKVLKTKRQRDKLYKENNRLKRDMELLAYPELLRDHEEVLRRLRAAQGELEMLRMLYVNQERSIATARRLLEHREHLLRFGVHDSNRTSEFVWRKDTKCGTSQTDGS